MCNMEGEEVLVFEEDNMARDSNFVGTWVIAKKTLLTI